MLYDCFFDSFVWKSNQLLIGRAWCLLDQLGSRKFIECFERQAPVQGFVWFRTSFKLEAKDDGAWCQVHESRSPLWRLHDPLVSSSRLSSSIVQVTFCSNPRVCPCSPGIWFSVSETVVWYADKKNRHILFLWLLRTHGERKAEIFRGIR